MKKRTIIALIILLATITTACAKTSLPVYEKTDEDGVSVIIDGVRYKEIPVLKWEVHPKRGGNIGYAGGYDTVLSEAVGDTDRNFVFIKGTFADYYDGVLYRADKVFPEPSAESVDELMWVENIVGEEDIYYNTIVDKNIIAELFNILNTGEKTAEYEMIKKDIKKINMYISCGSSSLPGARYILNIGTDNGKIICGNLYEKEFVEMPIELLEKIAGKEITY